MRLLLTALCISTALISQAQTTYNKFQWQATPALHKIDKEFENSAAVYVADDRIIEYINEKDGFYLYRTMHRIVHINDDKGIEMFNKIYLPFNEGLDIPDVKARTILPSGKVIEMDKKNIKSLKEDDGEYKIFALEGLTKGCEVEYYFTIKKYASFFGREVISSRLPAMKSHFELIIPGHLVFDTRSYNDLPKSKDTLLNEKRYSVIDAENIPEAEDEKYSMYSANLKRVEYKLSYNVSRSATTRLYTWSELAKKAQEIYAQVGDKEMKKVKYLLDETNAKGSEVEKIRAIENYLKKNFVTRDDIPDEDADDLAKVIKNKVASHRAICKLYCALFTAASVNYQIVLGGDRNDYAVDRNFENWNNAKNFLLYFPSSKKFLAPTELEYRYPWFPPTWGATNGLFCVSTTIGNFTTAVGEVRNIAMEDVQYSYSNMDMSLKFDKDDAIMVNAKQLHGGYTAPTYRSAFAYLPADEQDKFLKELVKFGTNSENILSHTLENKEMDQPDPYKPFILTASVKSTSLVERAGDKLIVKIGEVIGQQAEMYNAKPRQTGIDIAFPHTLVRHIEMIIPDGYKVKNLNDLNINEVYKDNDQVTMGFVSSYTLNGNVLTISITESYNRVTYPKSQYDMFQKVINAAADFNKISLVLEKTK